MDRQKQDREQLRTKRQARRLGRRKALSGVRKWNQQRSWTAGRLAHGADPRRQMRSGDVWN